MKRKYLFIKILTIFQVIWVILAIGVLILSVLGTLLTAPSLSAAWSELQRIWSPFNILNFVMVIILFAPAIGAYWLKEHLEAKWEVGDAAPAYAIGEDGRLTKFSEKGMYIWDEGKGQWAMPTMSKPGEYFSDAKPVTAEEAERVFNFKRGNAFPSQ